MRAERRRCGAWVWAAALGWGCLAAASWDADRPTAAQDTPEQHRDKIRDMPPAERREKIRNMSPAQKEALLDHQKHLDKLDPAEQKRLRDLCRQVEEDDRADELLLVMHRYYDWLTTHPYAKVELAGLSPENRVAKIKEMLKAEERGRKDGQGPGFRSFPRGGGDPRMPMQYGNRGGGFRPADVADREGVLKWQERYVNQHISALLGKISSPHRERLKEQLAQAKATDPLHRYEVAAMILLRWQLENPKDTPPVPDADLKELRSGLSESARKTLESLPPAQQWRFASRMINEYGLSQAAARHAAGFPPVVSEEELAEFFEQLSPQERAQLMNSPVERVAQDLLGRYIRSKGLPTGFGPGKGKRGVPLGPRRGPGFGFPDFPPPGKPPTPPDKPGSTGKPEPFGKPDGRAKKRPDDERPPPGP